MNLFSKMLEDSDDSNLPIDPIELYQTCNYAEGYGYLRGIQEEVLKSWHTARDQRDIICKMNTGSGKTLTGLLMLYSKMVEKKAPSLYVCPDNQLMEQTIAQSELYGIPVCGFDSDRKSTIPSDFLNGKRILVCNFQKLFNGLSIFVRQNVKIGAIVIDDAHKCLDIARSQSSLTLSRSHKVSQKLFSLFEPALKNQLPGSFARLRDGDPLISMKVPYWTWMDNQDKIVDIISEQVEALDEAFRKRVQGREAKQPVKDDTPFKWKMMADYLLCYDCYISGTAMEISPIHVPYQVISSYHEADHRYILSATFEDDYDLIKDLGISYDSIIKPIVPADRKDVGRRLILSPSRFDAKLTENDIREFISKYPGKGINVVVLVPSGAKALNWKKKGAEVVDHENIKAAIKKLDHETGNFMVFANRYDGMDLQGDACRVLVIDGLPMYSSAQEYYAEIRLESLKAGRKAQIIEQGLGRGVRSGADYCVVFLMGGDLDGFLGLERNLDHFTPITRAQIKLGMKLLDETDKSNSLKTIKEAASYCLGQHRDWVKVHSSKLHGVTADSVDETKLKRLDLAEKERLALDQFRLRKYITAADFVSQEIVGKMDLNHKEKGWYLQLAAQMAYPGNRSTSNDLQSKACLESNNMLHPPQGHSISKAVSKGAQASILKWRLQEFERPQDVTLHLRGIVEGLVYTPDHEASDFEEKLFELGEFLGFEARMPEADSGDGPDVLWVMSDGHFLILEAKSRRNGQEISKADIEQLQQAELWFKENYGTDAAYTPVTLQSNHIKGKNVHIEDHKVIDKDRLALLHKNLIDFATALQLTNPKAHTEENISKLLNSYSLTPKQFRATYIRDIK
jgi:hypothetical protein